MRICVFHEDKLLGTFVHDNQTLTLQLSGIRRSLQLSAITIDKLLRDARIIAITSESRDKGNVYTLWVDIHPVTFYHRIQQTFGDMLVKVV